jgi:hypothetical protein
MPIRCIEGGIRFNVKAPAGTWFERFGCVAVVFTIAFGFIPQERFDIPFSLGLG